MSHANLERVVEDTLTVREIRRQIASASVDGYYEKHHLDFEQVVILNTWFNACELALAHIAHASGESEEIAAELDLTLVRMPAITIHLRSSLSMTNQASLFNDPDGVQYLREPIESREMYSAYSAARVIRVRNSRLDESVRGHIENKLFKAWIDQKRISAAVTASYRRYLELGERVYDVYDSKVRDREFIFVSFLFVSYKTRWSSSPSQTDAR